MIKREGNKVDNKKRYKKKFENSNPIQKKWKEYLPDIDPPNIPGCNYIKTILKEDENKITFYIKCLSEFKELLISKFKIKEYNYHSLISIKVIEYITNYYAPSLEESKLFKQNQKMLEQKIKLINSEKINPEFINFYNLKINIKQFNNKDDFRKALILTKFSTYD